MIVVLGVNTVLWGIVGLVPRDRLARSPATVRRPHARQPCRGRLRRCLIAAHNEELTIAGTIRSAFALVPPGNVFVVSDGSTDQQCQAAA